MSDRLRHVPAGCYVLFCVAAVAFLASIFSRGTASFALRQTSIVLLVVSALYRVSRASHRGTGTDT